MIGKVGGRILAASVAVCLAGWLAAGPASAHHAQAMIGSGDGSTINRAALRAVIRPKDYVGALASPGDHLVAAPLVGDLWIICAVDGPGTIAYAGMHDLAKLGLSEQQLLALARRNTAKALGPLSRAHREHSHDLWLITGDPYESSRLLEPKRWASLARRLGGLAVAVPAPDIIVYGDDKPETVLDLEATAQNIAAHVPRPLSTTVYRWSPDGWRFELGVK